VLIYYSRVLSDINKTKQNRTELKVISKTQIMHQTSIKSYTCMHNDITISWHVRNKLQMNRN